LTKKSVSAPCYRIVLGGLIGGHSGAEIDKGRLNSNVTLGKFIKSLPFNYSIINIHGGLKDNAIPRTSEAIIACLGDPAEFIEPFIKANKVDTDAGLSIEVSATTAAEAYDAESSSRIIDFLCTVPNGIQSMSSDIEGLVQTSLNLGVLKIENDTLKATFAVRSSVNAEKYELLDKLEATAKSFGGKYGSYAHYPAWEYRKVSPLRDTMAKVYESMYGSAPKIEAIHAGLECGLFSDKIAGLDAVSFGPNLYDIHTTRERMSICSVQRTFDYLKEILKAL